MYHTHYNNYKNDIKFWKMSENIAMKVSCIEELVATKLIDLFPWNIKGLNKQSIKFLLQF